MAELAKRQHGVVARQQLRALGLGTRAIQHRLEVGRLHRLHPAVYAVGHRLIAKEGWWTAAVLASGPEAVLSHHSAAALWGLRSYSERAVEVTVPRKSTSSKRIRHHHSPLPADEVTVEEGIPVTSWTTNRRPSLRTCGPCWAPEGRGRCPSDERRPDFRSARQRETGP